MLMVVVCLMFVLMRKTVKFSSLHQDISNIVTTFCSYKHLNIPHIHGILMMTDKYNQTTTIKVTIDVHDRIDALRGKDETYNTVVDRALSSLEAKLRTEQK